MISDFVLSIAESSSSLSALLAHNTRSYPCLERPIAISLPIPELAPVTTAHAIAFTFLSYFDIASYAIIAASSLILQPILNTGTVVITFSICPKSISIPFIS